MQSVLSHVSCLHLQTISQTRRESDNTGFWQSSPPNTSRRVPLALSATPMPSSLHRLCTSLLRTTTQARLYRTGSSHDTAAEGTNSTGSSSGSHTDSELCNSRKEARDENNRLMTKVRTRKSIAGGKAGGGFRGAGGGSSRTHDRSSNTSYSHEGEWSALLNESSDDRDIIGTENLPRDHRASGRKSSGRRVFNAGTNKAKSRRSTDSTSTSGRASSAIRSTTSPEPIKPTPRSPATGVMRGSTRMPTIGLSTIAALEKCNNATPVSPTTSELTYDTLPLPRKNDAAPGKTGPTKRHIAAAEPSRAKKSLSSEDREWSYRNSSPRISAAATAALNVPRCHPGEQPAAVLADMNLLLREQPQGEQQWEQQWERGHRQPHRDIIIGETSSDAACMPSPKPLASSGLTVPSMEKAVLIIKSPDTALRSSQSE